MTIITTADRSGALGSTSLSLLQYRRTAYSTKAIAAYIVTTVSSS